MNKSNDPQGRRSNVPSHIIVSLDEKQPVMRVLQASVKDIAAKAKPEMGPARDVIRAFAPRQPGKSETKVLEQFNIALADLTEREANELRRENVVVVPNERRTIQGWRHSTEVRRATDDHRKFPDAHRPDDEGGHRTPPDDGDDHRRFPDTDTPDEGLPAHSRNELIAYAEGQRDAFATLMRRLESQGSTARMVAAGTADYTWPLIMLGVATQNLSGEKIRVAVLDTGIDLQHRDFVGRFKTENGQSFIEGVESVQDGNGHGTHCCGVVAGPSRPFEGPRYGVAPKAELMIGKVMGDDGSGYDSDIIRAIAWAAANGARVISMSLGSPRTLREDYAVPYQQIADKLARTGHNCLLIASAGNESERSAGFVAPVGNPAACPSLLAVGAIDRRGGVADFSCGELDRIGTLELAAPGVAIRSSVPGGYDLMSGTSMAAPHVAGLAALYLQKDPKLTPGELWRLLVRSTKKLGRRRDFGFGFPVLS